LEARIGGGKNGAHGHGLEIGAPPQAVKLSAAFWVKDSWN